MLHIDCNFYEKLNKKSKSKEKIKSPWEMLFIHVQQAGEASSLFPFFAIEFAGGEFFFLFHCKFAQSFYLAEIRDYYKEPRKISGNRS
jgi:hypothetical protein